MKEYTYGLIYTLPILKGVAYTFDGWHSDQGFTKKIDSITVTTLTKKGVVKSKNKGTCYIYAYAQNGIYKKIKVKVQ